MPPVEGPAHAWVDWSVTNADHESARATVFDSEQLLLKEMDRFTGGWKAPVCMHEIRAKIIRGDHCHGSAPFRQSETERHIWAFAILWYPVNPLEIDG